MTARTILRLLPPGARSRGEVLLEGQDLLRMPARALRQVRARRMAMIFQDPRAHIDPLWRSGDHLVEALTVHRGMARSAARREALRLLRDVGIADPERVFRAYPGELSGGLLQRVMIAGALAVEPDLIIADEPTTALDVTIQAEIVAIFESLRRERGLAMLFVTHDLELASAVCDRVVVLYAGRVLEMQQTERLFKSPLHPYTAGLLRARPRVDLRVERLPVIVGRPASPLNPPGGCPFHPRCEYANDRTRSEIPPLREIEPGAWSACHRTEEIRHLLRPESELVRPG
jgi:oligopeptide/dipeptide ABC transporter ATP-binding protein